ncbi:hypothetical protein PpBr36_05226 [Pyricularia pennisetigena]|uniref:hypothetical protein n=1 Tax=Pyricularia pennisetigena TaxID=1578925 RepID=UPI00114F5A83|nr:hypothetical protein PpBr36_05226 [Pyricularia pennisetigena]TLS26300.1 hypothetical protein PpBr36_05226 [Pyricularia pennisetigena]
MDVKHSLQRLRSPSRDLSLTLHILGLASFYQSFRYLYIFPTPISSAYGGSGQFLTIIGLGLSMIAFGLGLLADVTLSPTFFKAKNFVAVCANPLEVLISILYWGIALYDKELLMPSEYSLPWAVDIGYHAAPAIFLTIDLLFFSPPWTVKANGAVGLSVVLAFLYWGWIEHCASHNGWYPYPILGLLNTAQRAVFFAFCAGLEASSTMALKWLYGKVNGIEEFKREAIKPAKM